MKSWVGRPFHPTVFSVEEANERLRKKLGFGLPRKVHCRVVLRDLSRHLQFEADR
jgi:hypothetical protein